MNFDEMLEAWRTQDTAPIYRMNPDLLLVVVKQEHAEMRRESGWDLWFIPVALWMAAVGMLVVFFALLFAATMRGWITPGAPDYIATGIATGALLLWPVLYWAVYRRQPQLQSRGESSAGNSLREEIERNLARIDYHLSLYERLAPSLLKIAPFALIAILFVWMVVRMNGPFQTRFIIFVCAFSMFSPLVWTGGYVKKRLMEQRRRMSQLLDLLNVSE